MTVVMDTTMTVTIMMHLMVVVLVEDMELELELAHLLEALDMEVEEVVVLDMEV